MRSFKTGRRLNTSPRFKMYQVPMFVSWLLFLTHCAGNAGPEAQVNQGVAPASADALAANGAYRLINMKSQMALDLEHAGTTNGNPVVANAPSNAMSQQWSLRAESNGDYSLINSQTKQALDLNNGTSTPGTPLQAWTDLSNNHQLWQVTSQGNSVYQIVSGASGECLDLASGATAAGTHVQQWPCQPDSGEMLWQMVPVAGHGTSQAGNTNAGPPGNQNVTTTPSTAPVAGIGGQSYTLAQLTADMNNVLQMRTPIYSNRNLGNPSNIGMWTPEKLQSLLGGIITAHEIFYSNIDLIDLAHLIISEGAQESTGDYAMAGWSEGFIQSTPSTVGQDYINHGVAVVSSVGTMISPSMTINYDDPGQNVVTWAWYTYNVVAAGESMNEVALGNPEGQVTRDFGNAEFDWLAGPHNDRHNAAQAAGFQDYHDRIKDYFVQSKFGTADQFENLLNTPTGNQLIDEH